MNFFVEISQEPQWVRARWVLFILFWVAWVGMLVGAIVIVVNAPRCKEKPKPQWYQDTIVYEVNPDDFAGGLEGITTVLFLCLVAYLSSQKSDESTIAACLGVACHLSTTLRWGNPAKCFFPTTQ